MRQAILWHSSVLSVSNELETRVTTEMLLLRNQRFMTISKAFDTRCGR